MPDIRCPECGGEVLSLKVMYHCAKDHVWGELVDRPVTAVGKEPLDAVATTGCKITVGGKQVGTVDPTASPAKRKMPFGKYGPSKGDHRALEDIPVDYFEWCLGNMDNLSEDLAAEMQNQIDLKKGKGVKR